MVVQAYADAVLLGGGVQARAYRDVAGTGDEVSTQSVRHLEGTVDFVVSPVAAHAYVVGKDRKPGLIDLLAQHLEVVKIYAKPPLAELMTVAVDGRGFRVATEELNAAGSGGDHSIKHLLEGPVVKTEGLHS